MPKLIFTKQSIDALPAPDPSGTQTIYWDAGSEQSLNGLGLQVSGTSQNKTVFVQRRVGGVPTRVTIGRWHTLIAQRLPDGKGNMRPATMADIRGQASKLLLEMQRGSDPRIARRKAKTEAMTLRQAMALYAQRKRAAPITVRNYWSLLENHMADWLDKPLTAITRDKVRERYKQIELKAAIKKKKKGRDGTVGGAEMANKPGEALAVLVMTVLRAVFNYVRKKKGTVLDVPTDELTDEWHVLKRRDRIIEDLSGFYKATTAYDDMVARDAIQLLLFTAMRVGEACGLRWTECDFETKMIRVPANRIKTKQALHLPMSDHVFNLLNARRKDANGSDFVFPSKFSKSGHVPNLAIPFARISTACGEAVVAHDCRRTFATAAVACGLSGYELKGLLNHAYGNSSDITAGYVSAASAELLRPAMQKVTDYLKAKCAITPAPARPRAKPVLVHLPQAPIEPRRLHS